MVQQDRYCVDILLRLAAIRAAVGRVGASLLDSHARGCVAAALQSGDGTAATEELLDVIGQMCRLG